MSIACPQTDSLSTLETLRAQRLANAAKAHGPAVGKNRLTPTRRKTTRPRARKSISARKLSANRANAQKSTGPRTKAGKARSSQNALKHGLSTFYSRLPTECEATFHTFRA